MIRAIIIDDEPLSCRKIRRMLQNDPEIEVIGECKNGNQAVAAIKQKNPDLIFLDVQMPEMNGFEVLEALDPGEIPIVIFVTAYDRYALKAFDFFALDYLLKPFARTRFERTLTRAKTQLQKGRADNGFHEILQELRKQPESVDRLMVKSSGRTLLLRDFEIDWIEAKRRYVYLHVGKERHLFKASISHMGLQLNPKKFFRISRSAIINLDRTRELQQMFHGDYLVILRDGTTLRFSRRYRAKLNDLFLSAPLNGS